jgi:(p)ppGpp synthase/HD superfamily hydrolase
LLSVLIRFHSLHAGVAAHWDYKLQNKLANSSNEASTEQRLSLPATSSVAIEMTVESLATDNLAEDVIKKAPDIASTKSKIQSYIEALSTSRESLVKNNVFIFISSSESALDGRIVSIDPSASHVSDVLKEYGCDVESSTMNIYRNGVRATCDDQLSNGDVLTLPSSIINLIEF